MVQRLSQRYYSRVTRYGTGGFLRRYSLGVEALTAYHPEPAAPTEVPHGHQGAGHHQAQRSG